MEEETKQPEGDEPKEDNVAPTPDQPAAGDPAAV